MSDVEATDIVQMMREKSRGDLNSPFWNVCADEMQSLRAERDALAKKRDDFHMSYRLKCDEETKALHVELAQARESLQAICAAFPTSEDDCQHVANYLAEGGLMRSGGLPPSEVPK